MKNFDIFSTTKCCYCNRPAIMYTCINETEKIEPLCTLHSKMKLMESKNRDSREFLKTD